MWLWPVLCLASSMLVSGSLNFGLWSQQRHYVPSAASPINCYEYSKLDTHRFGRSYNLGWRTRKPATKLKLSGFYSTSYPMNVLNANQMISQRLDMMFPKEDDLVKEHAKLVQDINGLMQVVFIAPLHDPQDVMYDDSVFPDIIDTSSSTTISPTIRTKRPIKTSFPVIYVGGESTRHVPQTTPLTFPKPSFSLVGPTTNPLLKHPYPFVMQASSERPLRLCMPSLPSYPATTKKPSLWERLVNAVFSKHW